MRLSLESIDLALGGKDILRDVSFIVEDGQFVSVLGESGAGKSTTLKVIAGIIPQDSGRVLFDGACVDDVPTHERNTTTVFQDIRLFPHMDVSQNVAFPLRMRKVAKAERREVVERMLDAVQLKGMEHRRPAELSGGQQQRVALARALAGRPRAVLLDEPFSGLDEQLRGEMRQLVSRLHAEFSMTSLMVTHDPDEALVMSDRIIYMSDGRVIQQGTPAELLLEPTNETVRAAFDISSSIEGAVHDGAFVSGKLTVPAPDMTAGPAVLVRVTGRKPFIHPLV